MNNGKQICKICAYHLKLSFRSPRVLLTGILLFIYLHGLIEPVLIFSKAVGYSPTPWFFPYAVNSPICQMVLTFGGIALFCDAPFHSDMENYLLIRTKYRCWNAGQVLYVFCMSFFYLFFLNAACVIILAAGSGLELSLRWGKIWGTLVNTDAGDQFHMRLNFDAVVYGLYSPVRAFLYTFLLEWGVVALLGLVIYNLNRIKLPLGTICAMLLTCLDIAIMNVLPFIIYRVSPTSWAKLSTLTGNRLTRAPSVAYAFLALAITLTIGSALGVFRFKTPGLPSRFFSTKKGTNNHAE